MINITLLLMFCHVFRYTIFKDHVTLEDCILCPTSVHSIYCLQLAYILNDTGICWLPVWNDISQ